MVFLKLNLKIEKVTYLSSFEKKNVTHKNDLSMDFNGVKMRKLTQ